MRFRATASGSAAGSADRKSWARPTFADFSDRRDTVTGQLPASGSDPHGSDSACGRSVGHLASPSTIAKIRRQTLADSHARPATVVQATYDRLKSALDVGGRGAAHVGSAGVYPLSQDAIAYAWLLNDASMYLVGTGDNAPERESGSPACIDPLQPLLAGDMRPRPGLPRRLVQAISANILQCAAHCILPSHKPTNVSIWSVYRSESFGIQAPSRVPVRCSSRAAEHQCLRRVRRRRVFRSASVRQRRRKAGMRHPVFSIYCSPPGVGRANPRARPEHDVPVFARRWLRTSRSEYRMHGAIGRRRRRRHTRRVHGRRA